MMIRCRTWFRRVGIVRGSAAVVVVLWRTKLRPAESYKWTLVSDTRGLVPGTVGSHRGARFGASRRRRGKSRMLGAIWQHHPGHAGAEHDGSSRALGGIRDEDATATDSGESWQDAEGGYLVELAINQEALHHDVLWSEDPCDPVLGRQQLAGNAGFAGGRLPGDLVACRCLVPRLRFWQMARERWGCVRWIPHLANRLQSSSMERLSATAVTFSTWRRGGDLERADRTIVPGTSTMAQGVSTRWTIMVNNII